MNTQTDPNKLARSAIHLHKRTKQGPAESEAQRERKAAALLCVKGGSGEESPGFPEGSSNPMLRRATGRDAGIRHPDRPRRGRRGASCHAARSWAASEGGRGGCAAPPKGGSREAPAQWAVHRRWKRAGAVSAQRFVGPAPRGPQAYWANGPPGSPRRFPRHTAAGARRLSGSGATDGGEQRKQAGRIRRATASPGPGPAALGTRTPKGQRGPTAAIRGPYAGGRGRQRKATPHSRFRRRRRRELPEDARDARRADDRGQALPRWPSPVKLRCRSHKTRHQTARGPGPGCRYPAPGPVPRGRRTRHSPRPGPGCGAKADEADATHRRRGPGVPTAVLRRTAAGARWPSGSGATDGGEKRKQAGRIRRATASPGPGPGGIRDADAEGATGPHGGHCGPYADGTGRQRKATPHSRFRRRRRRELPEATHRARGTVPAGWRDPAANPGAMRCRRGCWGGGTAELQPAPRRTCAKAPAWPVLA